MIRASFLMRWTLRSFTAVIYLLRNHSVFTKTASEHNSSNGLHIQAPLTTLMNKTSPFFSMRHVIHWIMPGRPPFDVIRWSVPLAKTMPDRLEMLSSTHSLRDNERAATVNTLETSGTAHDLTPWLHIIWTPPQNGELKTKSLKGERVTGAT